MSSAPRTRLLRSAALAVAALFLTVSVAVPLASADHAYSHRYVLFGRVVDAEGKPVPGETVSVDPQHFNDPGPCADQPNTNTEAWGPTRTRLQTNAFGEFVVCIHTHAMAKAAEARFKVSLGDTQIEVPSDPLTRRSFATLQLPEARDLPADVLAAWQNNYTVSGRLWKDTGKTSLEQVSVYGETLNEENLTISFIPANGGETITEETVTNGYGDFAVRLPVPADVTSGKIRIQGAGFDETYDANLETRASDHELVTEESKAGTMLLVGLGIGAIVLIALALGGGFKAFGKAKDKRQLEALKAASGRKRGNR